MTRLNSELVLSLTDRVSRPARGVSRSIDNIKRQQQGAMGLMRRQEGLTARSAAGMGRASMMMAGVAGYAAPLAGALAVKQVVSSAADFQAAMNRVQAATAATGPEFTALGSLAKEMGRTTSFSANESALAIEMLTKNGLSAQQILDGALKTSMLTAAASGADLSTAADIVTDTMLNFKVNAKDLGTVADGISGVLLASKFGIDDYRLALGQAGGVAGGLGVTMADFNTAIAATSNSFASGSDAGTSFKTFLLSLPGKSTPAKKAIKALGLEFYDAEGGMKSMGEIAQELQDGLKGLSDEARNEYLNDIFGTDAMRTAIQLGERGAAGFREVGDAIGKASAQEQAEARMKGFWGEVEKTKSALEGAAIAMGDLVLPSLEGGLQNFRTTLDNIGVGIEQIKLNVEWGEIDAAKAAIGELMTEVSTLLAMDGTDSDFNKTMTDIAKMVSDAAGFLGRASLEISDAVKFAQDPIGFATSEKSKEWYDARGVPEWMRGVHPSVEVKRKEDAAKADAYRARANAGADPDARAALAGIAARGAVKHVYPDIAYPPTAPRMPGSIRLSPMSLMPGGPNLPGPGSAVPIPTPTPRPTGAGPTPNASAIRDIDQQLGALLDKKRQVEEGFAIAPSDAAATTMRAIADEMQRLIDKRGQIDGMTVRPNVDSSSIRGANAEVSALITNLQRVPGLARAASDAAQTARADYSGLHADLSRAG